MKIFSRAITKIRLKMLTYSFCVVACLALALASPCGVARAAATHGTEGYKAAEDIAEISKTLGDIIVDANSNNNVDDFQNSTWPEEFSGRLRAYDLQLTKSRDTLAGREIYASSRKQAVANLLATTQDMHQLLQQWSNAAEHHDMGQYNNATEQFNLVSARYNAAVDEYNNTRFAEAKEYAKQPLKDPVIRAIYAGIIVIALIGVVAMVKIFRKAGYAGWKAFVPFYNTYIMCKIAGLPAWYIVLLFIPIVNLVILALLDMKFAQKFGKSKAFGFWMLFILGPIGHCVLAFNKKVKYNDVSPPSVKTKPSRFGIWIRKIFSIPVSFAVVQVMMTVQYFFDNANEVTTGKILSFPEFAKIHPVVWLMPVLQVLSVAIFLKRRKLHDIVTLSFFALGIFISFAYYSDSETHLNGLQSFFDTIISIGLMYLMLYLLSRLVSLVRLLVVTVKGRSKKA
ncbi:MAG TPA: DUF5684 domain-containing protein [Patescibacteria group bacterium]|nr:DUF5684 domain-containing protein [Patescibacteria group bacterium]